MILCPIFILFSIFSTFNANDSFRVMTFNTWIGGKYAENGLAKIAKHIKMVDPDIVGLQEIRPPAIIQQLLAELNASVWSAAYAMHEPYPDTVVLTKHKFVIGRSTTLHFMRDPSEFLFSDTPYSLLPSEYTKSNFAIGTTIKVGGGQMINLFNVHLQHRSDGLSATRNKMVTRKEQLTAGERSIDGNGRAQNVERMMDSSLFGTFLGESDSAVPMIVFGDFNSASHLDWIEATKNQHGGWVFQWPTTKLMEDAGFVDSFRHLHPNPRAEPGITWSSNRKFVGPEWDWMIAEPQDRIDFIYYRPNPQLRPIRSFTYCGQEEVKPVPNHWYNDWPSDHYALITDFELINSNDGGSQNQF